jgi:hypothetical protein
LRDDSAPRVYDFEIVEARIAAVTLDDSSVRFYRAKLQRRVSESPRDASRIEHPGCRRSAMGDRLFRAAIRLFRALGTGWQGRDPENHSLDVKGDFVRYPIAIDPPSAPRGSDHDAISTQQRSCLTEGAVAGGYNGSYQASAEL